MTTDTLAVYENTAAVMPVVPVEMMVERYKRIVEIKEAIMQEDRDFGTIPGTARPTLLKPGAEKLCTFFGLAPDFEPLDEVIDWDAEEPFFFFRYRCTLRSRDGVFVAGSGIGSCNSREKKYRYRTAKPECPHCHQQALMKSKFDEGYYCNPKWGGCGANVSADDVDLSEVGQIANPDIADAVNTIDKMAQKRALVAATLVAVGASDFFTQDLEDLHDFGGDVVPGEIVKPVAPKHWTETQDWAAFWAYVKELGLNEDEAHAALKVKSMKEFPAGKQDAINMLKAAAAAKATDAASDDQDSEWEPAGPDVGDGDNMPLGF